MTRINFYEEMKEEVPKGLVVVTPKNDFTKKFFEKFKTDVIPVTFQNDDYLQLFRDQREIEM